MKGFIISILMISLPINAKSAETDVDFLCGLSIYTHIMKSGVKTYHSIKKLNTISTILMTMEGLPDFPKFDVPPNFINKTVDAKILGYTHMGRFLTDMPKEKRNELVKDFVKEISFSLKKTEPEVYKLCHKIFSSLIEKCNDKIGDKLAEMTCSKDHYHENAKDFFKFYEMFAINKYWNNIKNIKKIEKEIFKAIKNDDVETFKKLSNDRLKIKQAVITSTILIIRKALIFNAVKLIKSGEILSASFPGLISKNGGHFKKFLNHYLSRTKEKTFLEFLKVIQLKDKDIKSDLHERALKMGKKEVAQYLKE